MTVRSAPGIELDKSVFPCAASQSSSARLTTLIMKALHWDALAASSWSSTQRYLVLTVCELIRLKRQTVEPFMMHDWRFLARAVFLLGFEMMVHGLDWKLAKAGWSSSKSGGAPGARVVLCIIGDIIGGCSESSSEIVLALVVFPLM